MPVDHTCESCLLIALESHACRSHFQIALSNCTFESHFLIAFFNCIFRSHYFDHVNRSLLSSGGLMADVPCLDHSLDGCKGRPDDVQTTKHARRTHAWSRCARTSLGAHASLFGASGARFWIVTRATSAQIEEPSMVSILYIKSSIPDTYK